MAKWYSVVCVYVCVYIYMCVYVCLCVYIYVCVCMCVYVCMCIYICTYMHVDICHNFPVHSYVSGHLGNFHTLAITNNAAINIGLWTHRCLYRLNSCFYFFSYITRSRISGSFIVLFLDFWETPVRFSTVDAPIYILNNAVWGFPYLYFLTKICFCFWW